MGFSLLGSSSDTKAKATDKSVQVADQGVAYQPQHSGNVKTSTRTTLGKGASLVINQGLGAEEFNAGLSALAQSLSANIRSSSMDADDAFRSTALDALDKRVAAGTDLAVDNITASSPALIKKYALWAVGAVLLFGLVIFFGRKSK